MNLRTLPSYVTIAIFLMGWVICWSQLLSLLSKGVVCNLLADNAYPGIVALGMAPIATLSGSIGLSVAAEGSLMVLAILWVLTVCCGVAMGWLIDILAMPAFLFTLTGGFLVRGVAYLLSTETVPIRRNCHQTLQDAYLLTLIGVLTAGLIQTCTVLEDSLSSSWTQIVIGTLFPGFFLLQKGLVELSQDRLAKGGV